MIDNNDDTCKSIETLINMLHNCCSEALLIDHIKKIHLLNVNDSYSLENLLDISLKLDRVYIKDFLDKLVDTNTKD